QEEIPAEVIAESIALAQKQQEETKAELTSSELALFENPEAEQSTTSPAARSKRATCIRARGTGRSAYFSSGSCSEHSYGCSRSGGRSA
ncbi:unnamed protein product, partial [Prunus brigantina]